MSCPKGEYEIYQVEWELARLMDGSRPMDELAKLARQMGMPATTEHMESLLRQLAAYGILESPPPPPRRMSRDNLPAVEAPARTASQESMPAAEPARRNSKESMPAVQPARRNSKDSMPSVEVAPEVAAPAGENLAAEAAAEILVMLKNGDIDIARNMAATAHKTYPKNPALTETVRLFAALDRIKFERAAQPVPPTLARVPEPSPETVRPLWPVAEQLLRKGRKDDAGLLIEIGKRVDPQNPEVERLANWLVTGSDEGDSLKSLANDAELSGMEVPAEGAEEEEPQSEWSEQLAAAKRRRRHLVLGLGVLFTAGIVLWQVSYPLKVTAEVKLRPVTRREIRARVDGLIVEAFKAEGDQVKEGEILAKLETRQIDAQLAMLEAQRSQIDAELTKLVAGNRPEEIRRARNGLSQQLSAYEHAKSQFTRTKSLFANKLASQAQLDQAKFALDQESANTARARAELDLLLAGARKEDVAAKEAERKRLEAEISLAKGDLEQKTIRSPIDGFLITSRFKESVGKAVRVGDLVAEVAQLDNMRAEISVPESDIDAVVVGQPVVLKVKAFPDREFHGKVEMISKTATFVVEQQTNVVRVVATVENPEKVLRDEMTGFAEVVGERQPLAQLAGRRLLRWIRVRFLV